MVSYWIKQYPHIFRLLSKPQSIVKMFLIGIFFPIFLFSETTQFESLKDLPSSSISPNRILFLLQQGDIESGLTLYQRFCKECQKNDYHLLQDMGLIILNQGFKSSDPEAVLMSIFGAGISLNERAMNILEDGISSDHPQIQLTSMNFLSHHESDYADQAINQCLKSNSLLVRLEAAFQLCKKKHSKAVGQTEALMSKVPPPLHPLFPQLFAMSGTPEAIKVLKKLTTHPDEGVRLAAISSAAQFGRDDLLPQIRMLASHHKVAQQEICAIALGKLGDLHSIDLLKKLARSSTESVRLAALQSLYQLGVKEALDTIEDEARARSVPAIYILGRIKGSESILRALLKDLDLTVKINAAMSLLQLRDPLSLIVLTEFLLNDKRDFAIVKGTTLGGGLNVWKVIPSASHHFASDPTIKEVVLGNLEMILHQSVDLPENDFLKLCIYVLDSKKNALVPTVVALLERLRTKQSIAILKKYQQQAGAPLIRNYCNLALFRMGEEGPYKEQLEKWVYQEQKNDLIRFRPILPWEARDFDEQQNYQLTPEETSRLLVESFESLAQKQDEHGLDILVEAIKSGNSKNRYALAGLLIRASQ